MKKETMTSRQRVSAALNHQQPDRVPIDLGGFQTGIHVKAYNNLLDYWGLQEKIQIMDPVQQLAKPSETVLQRFHVDIRYITSRSPAGFDGSIKTNRRSGRIWHDLTDEFGVIWSMPDDRPLYMDISYHPLANASITELRHYPFPNGKDPSRFAGLRDEAARLRQETPYALSTGIGGVIYETCWYLRGLERWYIDMMENPAFCEMLLDKMLAYWMDYYTGFLREVGDLVDIVMLGDDLAGQDGPLFNPEFYRKVVKPRQKKLIQHIKLLTAAKILYHTCGGCKLYIPDLLDNGIDILNPIQIGAAGMEPAQIKRQFGDKLVFWGGAIDSQHVLPFASPQQVREEVRRHLEIFKPGGGYVFNNIHNIQAEVPVENIVALYDAAYEYGFYE